MQHRPRDGLQLCVSWVFDFVTARLMSMQEPTTVPFIEDIKQSVEYYGNRIIKEFKEKSVS